MQQGSYSTIAKLSRTESLEALGSCTRVNNIDWGGFDGCRCELHTCSKSFASLSEAYRMTEFGPAAVLTVRGDPSGSVGQSEGRAK